MSTALETVTELLQRSDAMEWCRENGKILGSAISLAESAGLDQYAYAARSRLVTNSVIVEDSELMLATFAIIESQHREDPDRFPNRPNDMNLPGLTFPVTSVLWMWKWVPNVIEGNPAFTREQVEKALGDMEAAYVRGGAPLKGVLQARLDWAIDLGDTPEVERLLSLVSATADDEYSHCAACGRRLIISAALALGDTERALQLLQELLEGDDECNDEPAGAYALCLDALAAEKRVEQINLAVDHILEPTALPVANIYAVARLARFLVTLGEGKRALSLIRRVLPDAADDALRLDSHSFVLAILALVAEAVPELGETVIAETAHSTFAPYFDGKALPLSEAGARAREASLDIAARFDQRNGTSHFGDETRRILETVPGSNAGMGVRLPADEQLAFADTPDAQPMRLDDAPRARPESSEDAARAARAYSSWGRPEDALALVREWLPRTEDPATRAALLASGGSACMAMNLTEEAEELYSARESLLGSDADVSGRIGAEDVAFLSSSVSPGLDGTSALAGVSTAIDTSDPEAEYAAAFEANEQAQSYGAASVRARSAIRLLKAAVTTERSSEVLALTTYLGRLAPQLPPEDLSGLHFARANALHTVGRLPLALEAVKASREHLPTAGHPVPSDEAPRLALHARLEHRLGRSRTALPLALRAAELFDSLGASTEAALAALVGSHASLRIGEVEKAGHLAEIVLKALGEDPERNIERADALCVLGEAACRAFPGEETGLDIYRQAVPLADLIEAGGDADYAEDLRAYINNRIEHYRPRKAS